MTGQIVRADGIVLGEENDKAVAVHLQDADLERHVLIVDPTGAGSRELLAQALSQQIERGGAIILFDGDSDTAILNSLACACRKHSRQQDLLVVRPHDPDLSNTYNVILSSDVEAAVAQAFTTVPEEEDNEGARHNREEIRRGIFVIISALKRAGLAYSFLDLSLFIIKPESLQDLLTSLEQIAPDSAETNALSTWLDQFRKDGVIDPLPLKQRMGGIAGRLYMFASGKLGKVLNTYAPEVDVRRALDESKVIYMDVPGSAQHLVATALREMIYLDVAGALGNRSRDVGGVPPIIVFNGAASCDRALANRLLAQGRSMGVSTWLRVASMGDLAKKSAVLAEVVLANTGSQIVFNLEGNDESLLFAGYLGREVTGGGSNEMSDPVVSCPDDLHDLASREFVLLSPDAKARRGFAPRVDDGQDVFTREQLNRGHGTPRDGADRFTRTSMA